MVVFDIACTGSFLQLGGFLESLTLSHHSCGLMLVIFLGFANILDFLQCKSYNSDMRIMRLAHPSGSI